MDIIIFSIGVNFTMNINDWDIPHKSGQSTNKLQNPTHVNCLKCDANHCVHNDQNCGCTASQVVIGPENAEAKGDTLCGTFEECK